MKGKQWIAAVVCVLQIGLLAALAAGVSARRAQYRARGERLEIPVSYISLEDNTELRFSLDADIFGDGKFCTVSLTDGRWIFNRSEQSPETANWFRLRKDDDLHRLTRSLDNVPNADRIEILQDAYASGVTYDASTRTLRATYKDAAAVCYLFHHRLYIDDLIVDGISVGPWLDQAQIAPQDNA